MRDYTHNPPLGIDLGTTYSVVARWNGTMPIHYKTGAMRKESTYQSVVYYDKKNDKYLTDRIAFLRTVTDPDLGVIGIKRKMDNKDEKIILGGKEHSPMEISAKIIAGMYDQVATMYPKGIYRSKEVVVTVPYYFKAHQCENTRTAVELAGLECAGIIQEPIAASLQYALQIIRDNKDAELDENILIFDLGGGTFDLTLFRLIISSEKMSFEVLASGGDDRLGGLDFDNNLAEYILKKEGLSLDDVDEKQRKKSWANLMERVIDAKEMLTFNNDTPFSVPYFMPDRNIDCDITRDEFETCISDYIDKIKMHIDDVLMKAGINKAAVTRVIKVGGSSKIPAFHDLLIETIGEDKIYENTDVDLCVAEGAAIYAAYLDDPEVFDRELEITTRTCHSLGIEIEGGIFYPIIHSNSKTPVTREQWFEPETPDTEYVEIVVYQGGARMAKDNSKIGMIHAPIPLEYRGNADIHVSFSQNKEQTLGVVVKIGDSVIDEAFHLG